MSLIDSLLIYRGGSPVEIKQLEALVLIARKAKLSHAAKALNLTSSGISLRLKRLETELAVNLFERRPNKLLLTESGRAFAEAVSGALDALDNAVLTARSDGRPTQQTISLALSGDTALILGAPLAHFSREVTHLTLSILTRSSSEIIDLVLDDRVDFGIGRFARMPSRIQAVDLHLPHSLVAISPKHSRRLGPVRLRIDELASHPVIVLPPHSATRRVVDEKFRQSGLDMTMSMEASGCLAIKQFTKLGLGVGLVHDICLFPQERSGFDVRDLRHLFGQWQTTLIYKKSRPLSSLHQQMIGALADAAGTWRTSHRHHG
jgi:DNA-binding transcriptional LysR family regulator